MSQVLVDPVIVRRAARMLFEEARVLHECHTIQGKWESADPVDLEAKRHYDEMTATARALNAAVKP
jgi:hypothetical protein